jgi:hypothetical protein
MLVKSVVDIQVLFCMEKFSYLSVQARKINLAKYTKNKVKLKQLRVSGQLFF